MTSWRGFATSPTPRSSFLRTSGCHFSACIAPAPATAKSGSESKGILRDDPGRPRPWGAWPWACCSAGSSGLVWPWDLPKACWRRAECANEWCGCRYAPGATGRKDCPGSSGWKEGCGSGAARDSRRRSDAGISVEATLIDSGPPDASALHLIDLPALRTVAVHDQDEAALS